MSLPTDLLVAGWGVFLLSSILRASSILLISPCLLFSSFFLNSYILLLSSSTLEYSSCLLNYSCSFDFTTTSQFSSILFLVRTIWISLVISETSLSKYLKSFWLISLICAIQFYLLAAQSLRESIVCPAWMSWLRSRPFSYMSSLFSLYSSLSTLSSYGENSQCVVSLRGLKVLQGGENWRLMFYTDFLYDEILSFEFLRDDLLPCELDLLEKESLQCLRKFGLYSCLEKSAKYLYLASKCLSGLSASSCSLIYVIICPLIDYKISIQPVFKLQEGKCKIILPLIPRKCFVLIKIQGSILVYYKMSFNQVSFQIKLVSKSSIYHHDMKRISVKAPIKLPKASCYWHPILNRYSMSPNRFTRKHCCSFGILRSITIKQMLFRIVSRAIPIYLRVELIFLQPTSTLSLRRMSIMLFKN